MPYHISDSVLVCDIFFAPYRLSMARVLVILGAVGHNLKIRGWHGLGSEDLADNDDDDDDADDQLVVSRQMVSLPLPAVSRYGVQ